MLKNLLFILICIGFAFSSEAQNMRKKLKKRTAEAAIHGALGYYGNPHWSTGANIHYLHGIGRHKQWLSLGGGIRANVFSTSKREYTTSSQRLTALNRGGADTMYLPEVQTNSLNAYFAVKIHIKKGVDVFINTDIGGINFGDSKDAFFRSYETDRGPLPGIKYKTEPYAFNINIPWGEGYGSIVSEIYGSFRLSNVLKWRLGFNHFRNEYKVDRNIALNGKRFYQSHWLVMTGLAFDIRWQRTMEQTQFF